MHIHLYVYIYLCIRIYICAYMYIHTYMCRYIYIYNRICIYVSICICVYTYIFIYIHVFLMYMYTCICICCVKYLCHYTRHRYARIHTATHTATRTLTILHKNEFCVPQWLQKRPMYIHSTLHKKLTGCVLYSHPHSISANPVVCRPPPRCGQAVCIFECGWSPEWGIPIYRFIHIHICICICLGMYIHQFVVDFCVHGPIDEVCILFVDYRWSQDWGIYKFVNMQI